MPGAECDDRPSRCRPLRDARPEKNTQHRGGAHRGHRRANHRDVGDDDDDRGNRRALPRYTGELEPERQRDGDEANVEPGNRKDVRESGRGKAIAHFGREIAAVGDEQCAHERSVAAESAIDRAARGGAQSRQHRRLGGNGDRRPLHQQAALRAQDTAMGEDGRAGVGAALSGTDRDRCGATGESAAREATRTNRVRNDDSDRVRMLGALHTLLFAARLAAGDGDAGDCEQHETGCGETSA